MAENFDPFSAGLAPATVQPPTEDKPGVFNPFASGAAVRTDKPVDPNAHWRDIFSDAESPAAQLAEPLKTAIPSLDKISEDPLQARKRAISQSFVAERTGMKGDYLERNWDSTKSAYAKQEMGVDAKEISDDEFFSMIGLRIGAMNSKREAAGPEDTLKPWTWRDTLASDAHAISESAGKFLDSINGEILPEAPKDLPDFPGMIAPSGGYLPVPSPAVIGGLYNGVVRPMVTPMNIAAAGALSELSVAAKSQAWAKTAFRAISGIYTSQMAYGTVRATPETLRVQNDPNSSLQDKITAWSGLATNTTFTLLGALGTVHDFLPEERRGAVLNDLKNKTPAQAAEVLRTEAVTSPPETADALNHAATRLDEIGTWDNEGGHIPPAGPEKIAAAAIRQEDGSISEGENHAQIREELGAKDTPEGATEGFVTTEGRFVDRAEARQIAEDQGQLKPEAPKAKALPDNARITVMEMGGKRALQIDIPGEGARPA